MNHDETTNLKHHVDVNCDMSEDFGTWMFGQDIDAQMIPLVSSINVAGGFHAHIEATAEELVSDCL